MRYELGGCLIALVLGVSACTSSSDKDDNSNGDPNGGPCELASLVTDLWPGAANGDPDSITAHFGKLYFKANDGEHGEELWVYDPQAEQSTTPSLVADIIPDSGGSDPDGITVFEGKLYFAAYSENFGREFFEYDPANPDVAPVLVADINPGAEGSDPGGLTVHGGKLFFIASDGVLGRELYTYDSIAGASLVADIRPGERGSNPSRFTEFDNRLFFRAHNGDGLNLWVYDVVAGDLSSITISATPVSFGGGPDELTVLNEKLYFFADDGVHGVELWVYDSTSGAALAADIRVGSASSLPVGLNVMQDKLYFVADDGTTGNELWVYDQVTGAQLVVDLNPGPAAGLRSTSNIAVLDDKLLFVGVDEAAGPELRVYNPDDGLVSLIADIVPGFGGSGDDDPEPPDNFVLFDDKLYFTAHDGEEGRVRALWVYSTDTDLEMLSEAWPGTGITRVPEQTVELNGRLYFNARNDNHGAELWLYDSACQ